jgi:hypothetical protein
MSVRQLRNIAASLRTGIRIEIVGLDFKICWQKNLLIRESGVSFSDNFETD